VTLPEVLEVKSMPDEALILAEKVVNGKQQSEHRRHRCKPQESEAMNKIVNLKMELFYEYESKRRRPGDGPGRRNWH
jgi:hypothetical protein